MCVCEGKTATPNLVFIAGRASRGEREIRKTRRGPPPHLLMMRWDKMDGGRAGDLEDRSQSMGGSACLPSLSKKEHCIISSAWDYTPDRWIIIPPGSVCPLVWVVSVVLGYEWLFVRVRSCMTKTVPMIHPPKERRRPANKYEDYLDGWSSVQFVCIQAKHTYTWTSLSLIHKPTTTISIVVQEIQEFKNELPKSKNGDEDDYLIEKAMQCKVHCLCQVQLDEAWYWGWWMNGWMAN